MKLVPVRAATAHQRIAPKSSAGYPGDALKTLAPAAVSGPAVSPVSATVTLEETGLASWYGQAFDGKLTANGEIFDVNAMTAAHPTLPLPSLVQVINRENGREVVVRVNDRGPFVADRIIDLSRRAADALDLTDQGTAEVSIRYLGPAPAINIEAPSLSLVANERQAVTSEPLQLVSAETQAPRRPSLYDQDILLGGAEPSLGVPDPGQSVPTPARTAPKVTYAAATPQAHSPAPTPASYTPQSASAGFNPGVYVQIGSFSDISNAQQMSATVDRNFNTDIEAARVKGADYFRVFIGPFPTKDAAERAKLQMKSNGIRDGFLVLR
ncbi:septal ring lytic transglycosylase RlpA family protein [Henriciella litoralis]|uniref:septal ring lytic transglycosylase RlpA family protein n=1 Tax=Henriciella litoralis TaxID=568102 RepID=UPI002D21C6BF|nr:septal ring lytic transglycosylase RlpA family protein [Henriciella litoralis]